MTRNCTRCTWNTFHVITGMIWVPIKKSENFPKFRLAKPLSFGPGAGRGLVRTVHWAYSRACWKSSFWLYFCKRVFQKTGISMSPLIFDALSNEHSFDRTCWGKKSSADEISILAEAAAAAPEHAVLKRPRFRFVLFRAHHMSWIKNRSV